MTGFEFTCAMLWRCFPLHYQWVHKMVREMCRGRTGFRLLDVGGRKSPYTINVNCSVDILDLPRASELQEALHLGLSATMMTGIQAHRSNIRSLMLGDITTTDLPSESYDGVVSVEVIEHVPNDAAFISQIHRLLKPGGSLVLTTPNGEVVPNRNPDHVRHYTRAELVSRLRESFADVRVTYGVRSGYLHRMSIKGWASRKLHRAPIAPWLMLCALLAGLEEPERSDRPDDFRQLLAVARKALRQE